MDGLYDAIGTIAAAAHAAGDHIDENTYPTDDANDGHGLDIFHRGQYYRFRAVPNEPRFTVGSPFLFVSRLQEQYTLEGIDERVDADIFDLSEDEQNQLIESVLRSDLETATEHEDEFQAAFQEQVTPIKQEVLRLTYDDDELWNGVMIRDRLFPRDEQFGVREYRTTIEEIRATKAQISKIMLETVPPLDEEYDEEAVEPADDKSEAMSSAFY